MLPRLPSLLSALGLFLPRVSLGFLPALTALAPVAGQLLGGMGESGAGSAEPPPPPINNTATFGAVSFGGKYLGDAAVKAAPGIISAAAAAKNPAPAWLRVIPWAIGGVVAFAALILFIPRRK